MCSKLPEAHFRCRTAPLSALLGVCDCNLDPRHSCMADPHYQVTLRLIRCRGWLGSLSVHAAVITILCLLGSVFGLRQAALAVITVGGSARGAWEKGLAAPPLTGQRLCADWPEDFVLVLVPLWSTDAFTSDCLLSVLGACKTLRPDHGTACKLRVPSCWETANRECVSDLGTTCLLLAIFITTTVKTHNAHALRVDFSPYTLSQLQGRSMTAHCG